MEVIIKDNQTVLDIAVQHYGNAAAVAEILWNNPQLTNDIPAVIMEGYEPGDFYPHIKLKPGQKATIDEDSSYMKKNVIRKIDREVTTYITESWQEQLNK